MSILVIEVTSNGIIFGSDRNVTTTNADGSKVQRKQTQKVLKWPNGKALLGFVGVGIIGGVSTSEWMTNFINRNSNFDALSELAEKLKNEVQQQRIRDEEKNGITKGLIIHLAGFVKKNKIQVPEIYLIANVHGIGRYSYDPPDKHFGLSEEFWRYFPDTKPREIRQILSVMAKNFTPFWFHQGFDLGTFNILGESIKIAFKQLCSLHPSHEIPKTLEEWEKHMKMQVLIYGAYFEAFREKDEQFVGGGVDTVSINWPEISE